MFSEGAYGLQRSIKMQIRYNCRGRNGLNVSLSTAAASHCVQVKTRGSSFISVLITETDEALLVTHNDKSSTDTMNKNIKYCINVIYIYSL